MWRRSSPASSEIVDGIVEELASLRTDVHTPPAMVARVMGEIEARPSLSLLAWLQRPLRIVFRVSPMGMVGGTVGLALAGALLVSTGRYPIPMSIASNDVPAPALASASMSATVLAPPASGAAPKVLVRFALRAKDARRVAVAGTFNNWNAADAVLTSSNGGGVFTGTLALPPGDHEYMFVVDGRFVSDPNADEYRPDGFGNLNALLRL
ncbi:MAG TPA: glycogen-binding domain-containing protein [Polyangia bacterium]|jgi:hypothetical protein